MGHHKTCSGFFIFLFKKKTFYHGKRLKVTGECENDRVVWGWKEKEVINMLYLRGKGRTFFEASVKGGG